MTHNGTQVICDLLVFRSGFDKAIEPIESFVGRKLCRERFQVKCARPLWKYLVLGLSLSFLIPDSTHF
jgi:hypothetical protein